MKKNLLNAVHGTPLTKAAQKKIKGGSFDFEPEPCDTYYVRCRNMSYPMLVFGDSNDVCRYICGRSSNVLECRPNCFW